MKNYFKNNIGKDLTKNEEIFMDVMMMVTMFYKLRHSDLYDDESNLKSKQISISINLLKGCETYFIYLIPLHSNESELRKELTNIFCDISGLKHTF